MRFKFIEEHRFIFSIGRVCRVMNVSSRGLRAFRSRPASRRQRSDLVTLAHIKEQSRLSLGSYGRPRMTEELKEIGLNIGHRRVGRLMRQNGISVIRTRKHKATTDSNHRFNIAPNLLDRNFVAEQANQKCLIGTSLRDTLSGNRRAIYPIFGRPKGGFTLLSFLICILAASSPSHGLQRQTTVR